LRILQVDDDASFLRVSKKILELQNNFEIDTATSVDEAFCKLKKQPYDAIVSDYEMPLKNGLDFLKELKQQKNHAAFIVFSGKEREVAIRALNLGADHYIHKSGPPEVVYCELANAIRNIVERKKEAGSIKAKSEAA
jgi:DNA-binding response OmpR family regulator